MGTATLEAKIAQHLVGLAHETLFQVFLDVRKAYDVLNRGGGLGTPEGIRDGY